MRRSIAKLQRRAFLASILFLKWMWVMLYMTKEKCETRNRKRWILSDFFFICFPVTQRVETKVAIVGYIQSVYQWWQFQCVWRFTFSLFTVLILLCCPIHFPLRWVYLSMSMSILVRMHTFHLAIKHGSWFLRFSNKKHKKPRKKERRWRRRRRRRKNRCLSDATCSQDRTCFDRWLEHSDFFAYQTHLFPGMFVMTFSMNETKWNKTNHTHTHKHQPYHFRWVNETRGNNANRQNETILMESEAYDLNDQKYFRQINFRNHRRDLQS